MIGFQAFRRTPTSFEINGPILSFANQPSSTAICDSRTYTGITTPLIQVTYNGYPVRGYLYHPTSTNLGSSLDIIVLYHGTITSQGVSPADAASTFLNIALNRVNLKDKLIFSVAYPQDAIPLWEANPSLPEQQFPGLNYPTFYLGDNIVYAEAALLWVKNNLNSYLSSNGITKTVNRVFTFGHSQGAYLAHRLNTMHAVDGVISNAPGPIDLLDRCSGAQNTINITCNKIRVGFGTTTANPSAYNTRSLKSYLSGTLSPTLFTQALDDDSYQVNLMQNTVQVGLSTCTNCSTSTFNYYATGGHDAFVTNTYLQKDIRNFVSSSATGIATFIGIATAQFPSQTPPNPATNSGSISYRWYEVGVGALVDGANIAGSATTTLVLSNLSSPEDNNRRFYLNADYVSSGTTPNAINDSLNTSTASLTVYPNISIASQPSDVTTITNNPGIFNILATTTDSSLGALSYQWKLNGQNVTNGNVFDTVVQPVTTTTVITAEGYSGPGIYFDLTAFSDSVSVTFSTSEESGIFHYINIPGIKNFPENNGSQTFTLSGRRIYGPCSAPNGGLYIGAETPVGGSAVLVVEEGGDDWNDMILYANRGYFRRLNTAPQTTQTVTSLQTLTRTTTVSGATTPSLRLSSDRVGIQTVSCTVSHTLSCGSPLISSNAVLNVTSADSIDRSILKYEIVRDDDTTLYSTGEQNIFTSPLNFSSDINNPSRNIIVYAPEKNVNVKITMAAASGQSFSGNLGGEGGTSSFEYTLKRNTEYIFKLNPSANPFGGEGGGGGGAFFYEKGRLLAVCGGGGGASSGGKGGNGGGIGLAGQSGFGRNAGAGGVLVSPGSLNQFGTARNGTIGGRVESCTIGNYYQSQGISPCSDVGQQQWRNSSGSITNGTATILRGFKAGASNRNNGGNSSSQENGVFVGGGGAGAVGGNATQASNSSGGGGSGYTSGSISILNTQLGGNLTQNSFVIIEVQP